MGPVVDAIAFTGARKGGNGFRASQAPYCSLLFSHVGCGTAKSRVGSGTLQVTATSLLKLRSVGQTGDKPRTTTERQVLNRPLDETNERF